MIDNIELIMNYNLIGAKITNSYNYCEGRPYAELWLTDDEYIRTGVRKLGVTFYNAAVSPKIKRKEVISAVIYGIEFEPAGTGLAVSLGFKDGRSIKLTLAFEYIQCTEYEYDGMSYTNVYDKEMQRSRQFEYIFSDQYKMAIEEYDAGQGYIVQKTGYADIKEESEIIVTHLYAYKAVLIKDGEEIYTYQACGDTTPTSTTQVIRHSNSKEYFLFKEDLYGLSILDIAEKKTHHYIPAGYDHDKDYPCGESFIITDIHYDPATDLIAFGGCFWAAPSDVMVGDFSDPMNYNPHFTGIHDIVDPEYAEITNIDFVDLGNGCINCTTDDNELSISLDIIREAMKSEI